MTAPFRLTPDIARACASIERALGRCEALGGLAPAPRLRRANQIRTVHATTAIEGNTLSIVQVTAVLEGKRVVGPAREILEVQRALALYERADLDPRSERDLLRAHATLMTGLVEDAGRYRRGDVGIFRGARVTHVAPPATRVPTLMKDLFAFARRRESTPPLVKACVLHYELELIHPFSDGNGRLGRWWQHALLRAYSPVFAHVPVESTIRAEQKGYYAALSRSDRDGDATRFVQFMLERLLRALDHLASVSRPDRATTASRIAQARRHFAKRSFSRRDYLGIHPALSTATASRDLQRGVVEGSLRVTGDKATARYVFVARGRA